MGFPRDSRPGEGCLDSNPVSGAAPHILPVTPGPRGSSGSHSWFLSRSSWGDFYNTPTPSRAPDQQNQNLRRGPGHQAVWKVPRVILTEQPRFRTMWKRLLETKDDALTKAEEPACSPPGPEPPPTRPASRSWKPTGQRREAAEHPQPSGGFGGLRKKK